VAAYAIGSRLRLTSDFTYFLNDPVNGDAFRQVDRRGVFGDRCAMKEARGRWSGAWAAMCAGIISAGRHLPRRQRGGDRHDPQRQGR
jgi:hypothetical protein